MAATTFGFGSKSYTIAVENTWEEALSAAPQNCYVLVETTTALTGLVTGALQWYVGTSAPTGFWHSVIGVGVTAATSSGPATAKAYVPAGMSLWVTSLTGGGTPKVVMTAEPAG